jgi:hypothetical protein
MDSFSKVKLFQGAYTPTHNYLMHRYLSDKSIPPNVVLLQSIMKSQDKNYLISVALSLRFGADSNAYIIRDRLPSIHVLAFIYTIGLDQLIPNTIQALLVMSGSNPTLPLYENEKGITVRDWYRDQHVPVISSVTLDPDTTTMVAIMLDKPSISAREYTEKDITLAIKSFSSDTLEHIPITDSKGNFSKAVDDALTHLNTPALTRFLSKGNGMTYIQMNRLVLLILEYYAKSLTVLGDEAGKMLIAAITAGVPLDTEQYNIVANANTILSGQVLKIYNQPMWKKMCSRNDQTLAKSILYSLNGGVEVKDANACAELTRMSLIDRTKLRDAARRRQEQRINVNLGYISEFIDSRSPSLVCSNKMDDRTYNDIDIAYYRDDTGAVWCFTTTSFEDLIRTGKNPHTSKPLPAIFITQLVQQRDMAKRLGIITPPPEHMLTPEEVLYTNDEISGKASEMKVRAFIELGRAYGITEDDIKRLPRDKLQKVLGDVVDLNKLTETHALITTAYIVIDTKSGPDRNEIMGRFSDLVR